MKTTSPPRKKRRQRVYDRIISTALDLIIENGANNLSVREIARRIDYTPGAIYDYFDGKAEILAAVKQSALKRFSNYLENVPSDLAFAEYIVQLGQAYIRFAHQHKQEFLLIFTEVRDEVDTNTADSPNLSRQSYALLFNPVKAAIEEGLIRTPPNMDAAEVAYGFWSLVHGMSMLQTVYTKGIAFETAEIDPEIIAALARGFLAK